MSKRSPRLQFTEEERASPELQRTIKKADKAADKLEKAEAKIPKKAVKVKKIVILFPSISHGSALGVYRYHPRLPLILEQIFSLFYKGG